MRGRWIAVIIIVSLLFVFEAPIVPVEGSQIWPSYCGKIPTYYMIWNYTDWESLGHRFLGLGNSLRRWHASNTFCGRLQ